MDYNTQRENLRIPEYGRIVQQMVDHCCSLQDKAERNKAAKTIVSIMENMNPSIREEADYKKKLWDQLAEMSAFKLDIDWPYDVITNDVKSQKPERLSYSDGKIKFRHYGKISENMLSHLQEETDPEKKQLLFTDLANYMKRSYVQWKKELIPDDVIYREITFMSEGQVQPLENVKLGDCKEVLQQQQAAALAPKKKKKGQTPQPTGNPQKKKKKK
ncbi:MAG: DUF4290 domain-containing protein [Bacteroidales bacterium]|nr:DUF4290 domain-containing protein [Bacteroidales bacterium]